MVASSRLYHLFPSSSSLSDVSYSTTEVAQFALVANRAAGSPTQAVIHDFIARGLTVDHLFLMLKKMDHVQGMKILKDEGVLGIECSSLRSPCSVLMILLALSNSSVSPSLKIELEQDNEAKAAAANNDQSPGDSRGQSHDLLPSSHHQFPIHPKHGPMPVNLPVVTQRPVPPPNGVGYQATAGGPYYPPAPGSDYTDHLGIPLSSSLYYYSSGGEASSSQYPPHSVGSTYQSPPPHYSHLVHLPPSLNQSMYPEPPSPSTQYDMSAGNLTDQHRQPDLPPTPGSAMTAQHPPAPAGYPTQPPFLPPHHQMSNPEPLRYTTVPSTAPPSSGEQSVCV